MGALHECTAASLTFDGPGTGANKALSALIGVLEMVYDPSIA